MEAHPNQNNEGTTSVLLLDMAPQWGRFAHSHGRHQDNSGDALPLIGHEPQSDSPHRHSRGKEPTRSSVAWTFRQVTTSSRADTQLHPAHINRLSTNEHGAHQPVPFLIQSARGQVPTSEAGTSSNNADRWTVQIVIGSASCIRSQPRAASRMVT